MDEFDLEAMREAAALKRMKIYSIVTRKKQKQTPGKPEKEKEELDLLKILNIVH